MKSVLDWLQRQPRRERYCAHRPEFDSQLGRVCTPKENPRRWWQYGKC